VNIKIFWDPQVLAGLTGLERPVTRTVEMILQIQVKTLDDGIFISGYDTKRRQFDAQRILNKLQVYKQKHGISTPILLVTSRDLFVKGSDFVFGLARESSGVAVVSSERLRNEFYAREHDDDLLVSRIAVEIAHEVGHILGLAHCKDSQCIMFPPETLDQLDGKKRAFCSFCQQELKKQTGEEIIDSFD